jgi:hypothetical protein
MKHVILIPERFCLGDVIIFKIRRTPSIKCDRLTVCCNEAWQFLFPTASDFVNVDERLDSQGEKNILQELKIKYPNAEFVRISHEYKEIPDFNVTVPDRLSEATDILIAPRRKPFSAPHRDWQYWPFFSDGLQKTGLNIKAIGRADMSFDCKVPLIEDLRDIASSMLKTRFVIATDSAFAHLAILLQVPLIVLWGEAPGIVPTQEYKKSCHARMEVLKKGFVYHLAGAWDDPNFAINEVLKIINK